MRRLWPIIAGLVFCLASISSAEADLRSGRVAFQSGDFEKAFAFWEQEAKVGDAKAQINIGVMSRLGIGVEPDSRVAARWFRTVGSKEDGIAQQHLAEMLLNGEVSPEGPGELDALLSVLTAEGSGVAVYSAVKSPIFGIDMMDHVMSRVYEEPKPDWSIEPIRGIFSYGFSPPDYFLFLDEGHRKSVTPHIDTPRNTEGRFGEPSREQLTQLGFDGSFVAKRLAANRLVFPELALLGQEGSLTGHAFYKNAMSLYQEAAQRGDLEAQNNLALLITADAPVKALIWLEMAANEGYRPSEFNVLLRRFFGYGAKADPAIAKHWMRELASKGEPEALTLLALSYTSQYFSEIEPLKGLALLKEAAKAEFPPAMVILATFYANGMPTEPPDPAKATELLTKAAKFSPMGADALCLSYLRRHKDAEARPFCARGAKAGFPLSQISMAKLTWAADNKAQSRAWMLVATGNPFYSNASDKLQDQMSRMESSMSTEELAESNEILKSMVQFERVPSLSVKFND